MKWQGISNNLELYYMYDDSSLPHVYFNKESSSSYLSPLSPNNNIHLLNQNFGEMSHYLTNWNRTKGATTK